MLLYFCTTTKMSAAINASYHLKCHQGQTLYSQGAHLGCVSPSINRVPVAHRYPQGRGA